jgi:hypothetical protein
MTRGMTRIYACCTSDVRENLKFMPSTILHLRRMFQIQHHFKECMFMFALPPQCCHNMQMSHELRFVRFELFSESGMSNAPTKLSSGSSPDAPRLLIDL